MSSSGSSSNVTGPVSYDSGWPAVMLYFSWRASLPATSDSASKKPTSRCFTTSRLPVVWANASLPESKLVGLSGPSDALMLLSTKK